MWLYLWIRESSILLMIFGSYESDSCASSLTISYQYVSVNNDFSVKQAAGGNLNSSVNGNGHLTQPKRKQKALKEKNRFGTVIVKVASLSSNRRVQERQNIFTITPRGALFHGTQCNPALVQKGKSNWDLDWYQYWNIFSRHWVGFTGVVGKVIMTSGRELKESKKVEHNSLL